jgi:hypothetical protein
MRVVNNIEREMMRAEWENWLLDENTRCKQVQMMLLENRTNVSESGRIKGADSQQAVEAKERERHGGVDNLRKRQDEYCSSCRREQEMLVDGRTHLAFG